MGIEIYILSPHNMIIFYQKDTQHMARYKPNTNSLTIAHYILLFLVTILCICIIAWTIIYRHNAHPQNNITMSATHISASDPCVTRVTQHIKKIWSYDSASIPDKYWKIAEDYINAPIESKFYGICYDVAFVCRVGQLRRDCDPCAVPTARQIAQDQQIADTIYEKCNMGK